MKLYQTTTARFSKLPVIIRTKDNNEPYEPEVLYSQFVPDIEVGDVLLCFGEAQFGQRCHPDGQHSASENLDDCTNIMLACRVQLCALDSDVEGTEISEDNGFNLTENLRHNTIVKVGSIELRHVNRHYVNFICKAAKTPPPLLNPFLYHQIESGQLSVLHLKSYEKMNAKQYTTGDSSELTEVIPVTSNTTGPENAIIFSLKVSDLKCGDVVHAFAEFQVTNDQSYPIDVSSQIVLASDTSSPSHPLSRVNGLRLSHAMHHGTIVKQGAVEITPEIFESSMRYVQVLCHAQAHEPPVGDSLTVNQDYGRLSIMVYSRPSCPPPKLQKFVTAAYTARPADVPGPAVSIAQSAADHFNTGGLYHGLYGKDYPALIDEAIGLGLDIIWKVWPTDPEQEESPPQGLQRGEVWWGLDEQRMKSWIAQVESAVDAIVGHAPYNTSVIAWNLFPEELDNYDPAHRHYYAEMYKAIKRRDPLKRPVFNHQPNNRMAENFLGGAAKCGPSQKQLGFIPGVQCLGADFDLLTLNIYPHILGLDQNRIVVVHKMREMQKVNEQLNRDLPIIPCLEMFDCSEENPFLPQYVRHDAYAAIAHGATGFMVWSLASRTHFEPTAYQACYDAWRTVTAELSPDGFNLAAVFTQGKKIPDIAVHSLMRNPLASYSITECGQPPETHTLPAVSACAWHWHQRIYILIVNSDNRVHQCEIQNVPNGTYVNIFDPTEAHQPQAAKIKLNLPSLAVKMLVEKIKLEKTKKITDFVVSPKT